jgi:leucyl-tRNA synthetase
MTKLNSKLDYSEIEKKWQKFWKENGTNKTSNDFSSTKGKFYILDMFPYPSGEGLHVGHPKGYIATDVYSRMKKMQGYNVLHPMGWDAFGLPAEQFAIKNKINPNIATSKNVARYKEQIEMLGLNYDWDREINTTDPKYYKWTQWMWKQMYKDGLAYESFDPINWCPTCKTGLANEDLDGNTCERCGTIVEKKKLRQWTIRITDYADRLLADLDKLNWESHIKELQRNWIGKSEGSEIDFKIAEAEKNNLKENKLKIFTTRADTLFGCTFMAISYTLAKEWIENGWDASDDIKKFIIKLEQEEKERTIDFDMSKLEKEGIDTGIKAINPANGEEVPIYIANYILSDYGTGAIMAVPAHDERDYEFAKKYNLEIRNVIELSSDFIYKKIENYQNESDDELKNDFIKTQKDYENNLFVFEDKGILINSEQFSGLESDEAIKQITEKVGGKIVSKYKLKDWVFARQRYWGEPFPIVFDENRKSYAVADKDLPVILPNVENYEPTDNGESPLANIKDWVEVDGFINDDGEFESCNQDDTKAKKFYRETNTMPQWAGSSWYYLRYIDPKNDEKFVNKELEKEWSPVDFYVGGAEHATRHLIYARFWHKYLFDKGYVNYDEPFNKLQTVGLIMAEDGKKMSKRYGNVVNPDDVIKEYGCDAMRTYEMFMGPFEKSIAWNTNSMAGVSRFLERVYSLAEKINLNEEVEDSKETERIINESIKLRKATYLQTVLLISMNSLNMLAKIRLWNISLEKYQSLTNSKENQFQESTSRLS